MQEDFQGNRLQRALRRLTGQAPILWETHAVGERMLVDELEPLRDEGYLLFHDRRLEPRGKDVVDTIVIGPPGVYLFDAKHWWGRVAVENSRLIQERRYRRDQTGDIDKLLAAAKRVGQVTHTYIHPFLVLTGEAQVDSGEFVSKVRVRNLPDTAALLRTQIQTLGPDDVLRLGALVDNNFPHVQADTEPLTGGPRPADSGQNPSDREARGLISLPPLPGFHRNRTTPPTELVSTAPPPGYLRNPIRPSIARRTERPAAPPAPGPGIHLPRFGTLLGGMVVLAVLLFVAVDPASTRSRLVARVTDCSILDEDAARQALGTRVEGHRRVRGGCVFYPADTKDAESALLAFRGGSAQSRADGSTDVIVRREDCGVLVVAPEDARLSGVRESAEARKVAAAACVRPGKAKDARARAQQAAERVVAAIRAKAAS